MIIFIININNFGIYFIANFYIVIYIFYVTIRYFRNMN